MVLGISFFPLWIYGFLLQLSRGAITGMANRCSGALCGTSAGVPVGALIRLNRPFASAWPSEDPSTHRQSWQNRAFEIPGESLAFALGRVPVSGMAVRLATPVSNAGVLIRIPSLKIMACHGNGAKLIIINYLIWGAGSMPFFRKRPGRFLKPGKHSRPAGGAHDQSQEISADLEFLSGMVLPDLPKFIIVYLIAR